VTELQGLQAHQPILWPVRKIANSHDDVAGRVAIYFDPF
jgi:hypothetical protein